MKTHPIHPCINCIYFRACGETTRTMPCNGRITKKEFKEKVEALEYITSDIDTMIDARKNEEEIEDDTTQSPANHTVQPYKSY